MVEKKGKVFPVDTSGMKIKNFTVDESLFGSASCDMEKDMDYAFVRQDKRTKEENGLFGIYDTDKNEWIIQPKYDKILKNKFGFQVYTKGKIGQFDNDGNLLIEPIYDKLYISENCFIIEKDGLSGLISSKGEIYLVPNYKVVKKIEKI